MVASIKHKQDNKFISIICYIISRPPSLSFSLLLWRLLDLILKFATNLKSCQSFVTPRNSKVVQRIDKGYSRTFKVNWLDLWQSRIKSELITSQVRSGLAVTGCLPHQLIIIIIIIITHEYTRAGYGLPGLRWNL